MFQGFSSQATSTPFGQTTFGAKPAGTGTFAAPAAFGSSGGSLFGSQGTVSQQPTSLFGSNTAAPAFGQAQTTQPSFGGFSGTGSSLFGSQPATNVGSGGVAGGGGGLFGGAGGATSAFGQAKPATAGGFGGFSASGGVQTSGLSTQSTGGGLFSQPTAQPQGQTPLFGAAPTAGTSGLFGSTAGSFGSAASAAGGGTTIKFTPVTGSDTMVKSGQTQTINTRHHCITCMKEYEAKSLEELRLEDYVANRKGPQQGVQSGGLFGAAPQSSLFGSSTIGSTPTTGGLFGNTSTTGFGTSGSVFGTSGGSLFGKTATAQPTAFGSTPATNTTNTFGFNAGATANNPFATNTAQKPFGAAAPQTGGGLFGTTTSQPSNVFGAPSTGGFGAFGTTQNQTSLGLFNQNKPFQMGAGTGGTQGATNFSFGQSTTAATPGAGGSSLFGAKPATGAFGSTGTSAFGQASTAPGQAANRFGALDFGQSNQTQTLGGGAFGTFNKPATSGFTFGQNTNTNTTLGGGLNLGGSNLFGNTAAKPGGLFGSTSGGGLFGSNTFGTSGTNTFGTTPNTGLGSSLSLGGSSLMMISGTTMQNNQNVNNPLNQQIMALASVPFGDMSLFKNVLQITGKTDELLKPTSPAAQKAINSSQNFTVSPRSGSKIKVKPIGASNLMKKSLFGGLDDEDTNNNINDSWLVKPSPKRLILRTKPSEGSDTTSTSLMTSSSRGRLLNMSTTSSTGSGGTPGTGAGNQDEEEVTFLTLGTPKFIQQSSRLSPASNKDAETQSSQSAGSADKLSKDQSLSSPASKSNTSLENNGNTSGQQKGQSPSANKSLAEDTSWTEKSVSNYTQTQNQSSENKENADHSSSSTSDSELEESLVVVADDVGQPHPTGIRLRRVGYYTIPPLSDLAQLMDADGRCVVDNFTIGRLNYGNVFYPDSFDVSGLNIDEIVHIRHKEIVVYPDDASKPPLGTGLNRRAQVTLDRVWPSDKNTRLPISDPQRLAQLDYEAKLRKASAKNKTRFVEYRPQTGSWVFKVDHFSKYGLSDSEEDDAGGAQVPSDVKKLKLTAAAVAQFPAKERPRRGLDMPGQTIMNGHGSKKTVFLDEGDQDMCDLADGPLKSVFDGTDELDLNHKSPAARFANDLGTSSHKVQVMKQSFYHEDDEDDYNEYNDDYMDMADFRADSILDVDVDAYERDILKKSKMADMRNGISLLRSHFASPLYDSVAGASPSDVNTSMPGLGFQAPIKVRDLLPSAAVGKPGLVTSPAAQLCGPPPPAVVPQSLVLKQMNRVVPWSQSLAAKAHQSRCLSDFSIFMGRRFKVGWSPSCTLISVSTQKQSMAAGALQSGTLSDLGHVLSPRAEDDFSPFVLQRLRLKGGVCDDIAVDFQESIEEHMEVALMHSIVGDEDGCPVFAPCSGNDELHAHCASAQATNDPSQMETTAIWELCAALWGDLDGLSERQVYETDETEAEGGYWAAQERKRALSEWLENCALAAIKEELGKCSDNTQRTVFTQLTAHQVMEACRTAQDGREHFMSLLLAQVGCGAAVQTLAEKQLAQWVETRADEMIDTDRLKLVQLVAGMPLLMATQGVVNVCEGLDWRRALAVHLWYLCSQSASITDALLKYETAFHGEDGYAAQPVPAYSSEWESSSTDGEPIFDVCYHLLRLYSFRSHPLERLLNPATHTSDPLDYRLSWLLMRTLEALGYSHLSQLSAAQIHTAFALQLESHGCWHWAVFVLMHLADARRRRSAVEEMIGRHVTLERPDQLTHEERFVLEKLRVPKQWLFKAKATMAKSYSRHEDEAIFLLEAEDWSQSHEVIMEHIAAKAIINEKYEYMWRLLVALVGEQQERAAAISGWEQRGALIWHYLRVVDEVNAALDQRNPYSLEKLQPQLTGLCTRIVLLPTPTAFHRLCQAEIVKRIANLIYSLFVLQRKEGDLDSVSRLAHLISNLPLPEDYAHQEMRQMVTSWQDTTL